MSIEFNNLKIFRKDSGLTQEQVAEKLNVSRQAVAKWENGETLPDIESCIALADLYGTTVDILVRNLSSYATSSKDKKHIFGLSKINEKGQLTLPKNCRDVFRLNAGDVVLIMGDEDKGIALVKLGNPLDIFTPKGGNDHVSSSDKRSDKKVQRKNSSKQP